MILLLKTNCCSAAAYCWMIQVVEVRWRTLQFRHRNLWQVYQLYKLFNPAEEGKAEYMKLWQQMQSSHKFFMLCCQITCV